MEGGPEAYVNSDPTQSKAMGEGPVFEDGKLHYHIRGQEGGWDRIVRGVKLGKGRMHER